MIVVDDDIDPANLSDVVWALSTRCDPPEDIDYIRHAWSSPADPMAKGPPYENNRAIVDACKPFGKEFPPVVTTSEEMKAQVRQKWPQLFS